MKRVIHGTIKDGQLQPTKEDKNIIQKFQEGYFRLELDNTKPRTKKQNRALHKFCSELGEYLNDAGLGVQKILKPTYQFDWTTLLVKDHLWRPFQIMVTGKESTTELESQGEIEKIHRSLMRELGEKHGVEFIPFPQECKSCGCLSGGGANGSNHYEGCEDFGK